MGTSTLSILQNNAIFLFFQPSYLLNIAKGSRVILTEQSLTNSGLGTIVFGSMY
jgi:hypothetical protein